MLYKFWIRFLKFLLVHVYHINTPDKKKRKYTMSSILYMRPASSESISGYLAETP